jgi:hypothetical protein
MAEPASSPTNVALIMVVSVLGVLANIAFITPNKKVACFLSDF